MIVTLNGNPFEFTLERERTIGEFLSEIEEWLERSRFSVSGLHLDGQEIPADKIEEIYPVRIDDVERIDLIATSWNALYMEALAVCDRFLEEAAKERISAREAGRVPATGAIAARFESSAASGILSGKAQDLYRTTAAGIRGESGDPDADIRSAHAEIGERIAEIEGPAGELKRAIAVIPSLAQRLESLPLELQTGKDVQAALTLRDFASFAAKLLRLLPILESTGVNLDEIKIDKYDFKDFFDELNTAFRELTVGYENGDAILVGDLAEYELAPRLRKLEGVLAEMASE